MQYTIEQAAIDWDRVGMARPVPHEDLITLALDTLERAHPHLDHSRQDAHAAIQTLRQPAAGAGRAAALTTHRLENTAPTTRGYTASSYLTAADDGQSGRTPRPVPTPSGTTPSISPPRSTRS